MKDNFLALDKNGTYILACAYGPDSMALLDLTLEKGIKPIVCFVNYHSYESIDEEENALRKYCEEKGLTLEVFDTSNYEESLKQTSFEEWARKARYSFFKKVYDKYNAEGLLIAHSQDDVLETYLTTKKLGVNFDHYGYSPLSTYDGMIVIRPLLNFSKEDVLEHNRRCNVPYSEHMSSYEHQHTRSLVRKEIERMNEIERDQLIREMNAENSGKTAFVNEISKKSVTSEELGIRELIALPHDEFLAALTRFVNSKSPISIVITPAKAKESRAMMLDYNPVVTMKLKKDVYLVKEYDTVSVEIEPDKINYSYRLDKPGKLETKEFTLDFTGGAEDRGIKNEDYPLTIRTMLPGDNYSYKGYIVPVRRMYLGAEMPREYRDIWPVFVNKDSKIVYVPRYRKMFEEYHTSTLVLHLPEIKK